MTAPAKPSEEQPRVWAIGTVPPPVTGMTLLTEQVVNALRKAGPIVLLNMSEGFRQQGIGYRLRRFLRVLTSARTLLAKGGDRNAPLYLTSNSSRSGLLLTGLLVATAARLGYCVYLHHHSYAYISKRDWRMAWIDRTMGRRGVHVVHAQQMIDDFRAQYPTQCDFAVVYPSVVGIEVGQPKRVPGERFCIGHMSNLTPAKGLNRAIETFRVLRAKGCDVRLKLAGPFLARGSEDVVRQAQAEYPEFIEYLGPVHGEAKSRFFAGLDVFLFPTLYENESWGIVLNEAMAAGVPVISYDRGCVRTVVGDDAGRVIDCDTDFPSAAAPQIQRWMENADEYAAASRAAIAQANKLREEGMRTLDQLVTRILSSAGTEPSDELQRCTT